MLQWFSANIATIIAGLIVLAIVAAVIVYQVKNKKKGGSSCGCDGCGGCSMSGVCHSKK